MTPGILHVLATTSCHAGLPDLFGKTLLSSCKEWTENLMQRNEFPGDDSSLKERSSSQHLTQT